MKAIFKEIKSINDDFYKSEDKILRAVSKLGEEYGELVRGINMSTGVKKTKWNSNKIKENITEEAADTIQNIFSICEMLHISYENIMKSLRVKNTKWKTKYVKIKKNVK